MIWVISATYICDYKLRIEFNDGTSGLLDFYPILSSDRREKVRQLLDAKLFSAFKTQMDTLCWENGIDFAPEFLYESLKHAQHVA